MPTLRLPDRLHRNKSRSGTYRAPGRGRNRQASCPGGGRGQAGRRHRRSGLRTLSDQWMTPNSAFQILTDKDLEALDVLRHSGAAHVMARAVMRLFPEVQLAFGPTVENGFYYDIESNPPIKEEDFPRIEEEMKKIVALAETFDRLSASHGRGARPGGGFEATLQGGTHRRGIEEISDAQLLSPGGIHRPVPWAAYPPCRQDQRRSRS